MIYPQCEMHAGLFEDARGKHRDVDESTCSHCLMSISEAGGMDRSLVGLGSLPFFGEGHQQRF